MKGMARWARAASGHAKAATPSLDKNCRRRMPPPRGCTELYASEFGDGARISSGSVPDLFDGDFLHDFADAQALSAYAQLAAAFHGNRHAAARDGAEAALVEDVF